MLLPEPDRPLTNTNCITAGRAALLVLLHLAALAGEELGGRVDAAKLEDLVAHRRFDEHGEVAAGGDRQRHLAYCDAEDVLALLDERQALPRIPAAPPRPPGVRPPAGPHLPAPPPPAPTRVAVCATQRP